MSTPVGPYSPVVRVGDLLVTSGQLGLGDTGLVEGLAAQVHQCLHNLDALARSEGAGREQIVKTTVFLTSMDHYAEMNSIYAEFFGDHRPARSAIAVAALPLGALIEIEAWIHAPR